MKKQEAHVILLEISINNDYVTGNILDCLYHQKYYKLIGIDYSRQRYTVFPQQINFVRKLEEDDVAAMFFFPEKKQKIF